MIKVVHFDYQRFASRDIKRELSDEFKLYPEVNYEDFEFSTEPSMRDLRRLEEILPEKDILLIHPGVEAQKFIWKYPERFPNLDIAFVVPGEFKSYHQPFEIRMFGYHHKKMIVDFVLARDERLMKREAKKALVKTQRIS